MCFAKSKPSLKFNISVIPQEYLSILAVFYVRRKEKSTIIFKEYLVKNLLLIGSTCVDVIIKLDHLPVTGEDIHPEYQTFRMGGCAYNAARIPKALDLPVTFITPVGQQGVFGRFVWQHLQEEHFTGPVPVADQENGCCYCFVEKNGERTFISSHGIEYHFDPNYLSSYKDTVFDYIYICGLEVEEPTGEKLVDYLQSLPSGTVFYAPGPRGSFISQERTDRIFRLHPILHLNEQEVLDMATRFAGFTSSVTVSGAKSANVRIPMEEIQSAARALQQTTQNIIIITCGDRGVCWLTADGSFHRLASEQASVVDTIGAGDSHAGALLSALSMELPLEKAMLFANRISAQVVSTEGASIPDTLVREIASSL